MPLAELQRRLGLADPTAHLQPRSNGVKPEPGPEHEAGAEAEAEAGRPDQLAGENGATGPLPLDGSATDAAAPRLGDSTAAADAPPGVSAAAPAAPEAAADPGAASGAAVAAEPVDPEPDAGVAPLHELYEALLRVLLQVRSLWHHSRPFLPIVM